MSNQNPFSENPYQAPSYTVADEYQNAPTRDWKLSWILFSFRGRIPRRVFWVASLGTMLVYCALCFLVFITVLGITIQDIEAGGNFAKYGRDVIATSVYVLYLPVLWIGCAIQAKRWHDRGKSGLWVLISFIPWIGALWVLIEAGCLRGDHGPNKYGADQT